MAAEGIHDDLDPAVPFASPVAPVVADTLSAPEGDFKVGDKVVYPGQGVVEVIAIEENDMAGNRQKCYVLGVVATPLSTLNRTNHKIIVPVETARTLGLRPLIGEAEVREVFKIFHEQPAKLSISGADWYRHFKNLKIKLATGNIYDLAEVFRDLSSRRNIRQLSPAEKEIYDRALELIVKEIAFVRGLADRTFKEEIEVIFAVDVTAKVPVADPRDRKTHAYPDYCSTQAPGPETICAEVQTKIAESGERAELSEAILSKATTLNLTDSKLVLELKQAIAISRLREILVKLELIASLRARPQAVIVLMVTYRTGTGDISGLISSFKGAAEQISFLIEEDLLEKLPGGKYELTAKAEGVINYLRK
ncbi:MAG: CarD family transcriptional regulator [Candidatus Gracilibacteria bacterium]|jgi:CarD family transcriptional regulator